MNVIHALAWYFPDSTGGTEVYVAGLVGELKAYGIVSTIAAARDGTQSTDEIWDGFAVHRYPATENAELAATRGDRPPADFDAFVAWLERQPRGIYHQHSWTTSCGLLHISAAKSLGFKTVLTIHVASNICLRGTMMEFGREACDGRVETGRCAACWSQERGLSRPAATLLSRIPQSVSRAAYRSGAESRILTALGARELATMRRRQVGAMADASDQIVAVCDWLADALRQNGIAGEKVVVNRQGVDNAFLGQRVGRRDGRAKFQLGFLGRCDPVKGLPVLLDAIDLLPRDIGLELVIHAVVNYEQERHCRDALVARTRGDPRIKFMPAVPRAELPATLAGFDMLAVPSQCLETGPLVVLEAQAVGVPVLGSNLGGIAELVAPGLDGQLVDFANPASWATAIGDAVAGRIQSLRHEGAPRSVRTMSDAARDMVALYARLA